MQTEHIKGSMWEHDTMKFLMGLVPKLTCAFHTFTLIIQDLIFSFFIYFIQDSSRLEISGSEPFKFRDKIHRRLYVFWNSHLNIHVSQSARSWRSNHNTAKFFCETDFFVFCVILGQGRQTPLPPLLCDPTLCILPILDSVVCSCDPPCCYSCCKFHLIDLKPYQTGADFRNIIGLVVGTAVQSSGLILPWTAD